MSDVKFNCPLKNKPIAEEKKRRERKSEREREKVGRGGERRGVCNKTILRNHEATPRAGLL